MSASGSQCIWLTRDHATASHIRGLADALTQPTRSTAPTSESLRYTRGSDLAQSPRCTLARRRRASDSERRPRRRRTPTVKSILMQTA